MDLAGVGGLCVLIFKSFFFSVNGIWREKDGLLLFGFSCYV